MAVKCPLCSNTNTVFMTDQLRFGQKADVRRCPNCFLIFLDQDSFSLPADFYESQYHQTYLTHLEPALLDPNEYYEKMKKVTRPWSDKIAELLTGSETILDFGCSTGHLLNNLHGKAGKLYGHELNRREVEFCRNKKGLDVDSQPLEQRFQEETFDFITMIFVLEHIAQPAELLLNLKKFLKPDGKFLILVPNVDDALLNFYNLQEFQHFYYCVEHLFYYNPSTIQRVFRQAGLYAKINVIQEYPISNHLDWGYLKRPADAITSRQGVPAINIDDISLLPKWKEFWKEINEMYQKFLLANGFGDRIWCEVGKDNEIVNF